MIFNRLDAILGTGKGKTPVSEIEKLLNFSKGQLKHYADNDILPSISELKKIESLFGISPIQLKLQLGKSDLTTRIEQAGLKKLISPIQPPESKFRTNLGELYQGDCIQLLRSMEDNSVDLIFADPPFNLNKQYKSNMDDNLSDQEYLLWCETWLDECVRVLKYGGSLFLWNLPKWNTYLSAFLNDRLTFRNWIACDIKFSLPISGRLYPSHYSLLYYVKGPKPSVFHPDRIPMETCRKCFNEIKDYGGYKNKMNKLGINISDIWLDIPPVRHVRHKRREGANELSVKLMDRILEMSSNEGDLVFDPFGGSGTTYAVAEIKKRRWIGIELGPIDEIEERLQNIHEDAKLLSTYRNGLNALFPEEIKKKRQQKGIWTEETFN